MPTLPSLRPNGYEMHSTRRRPRIASWCGMKPSFRSWISSVMFIGLAPPLPPALSSRRAVGSLPLPVGLPGEVEPGAVLELQAADLAVALAPDHDVRSHEALDVEVDAQLLGAPDLA